MRGRGAVRFGPGLRPVFLAAGLLVATAASAENPEGASTPVANVLVTAPLSAASPRVVAPAEAPQSVVLVPRQVVELGGQETLRDILRLDPRVSQHADEDSGQSDNVYIRGFSARNDLYRDGQLDFGRYYRDPFDLEAVEVLTGPSSVLFGRGSTGGVVDALSKKPDLTGATAAVLTVGTDDLARLTADVDVPVSASSALRVDGLLHTNGVADRDKVHSRRAAITPVFSAGIGRSVQFTLGWMHQSEWNRPDYGVPWIDIGAPGDVSRPANVPRQAYYGFADDFSRVRADIVTATLRWDVGSGWSFGDQLRYADYGRSYRVTEPSVDGIVAPGTPLSDLTAIRTVRGLSSRETFLENQAFLTGAIRIAGFENRILLGADVGRETSDPTTFSYANVPGTNLVSPNENSLFSGTTAVKSAVQFTAQTAGAYAGDTLEVGHGLTVEGLARVDRFGAAYRNAVPTPIQLDQVNVEPSYRAALIYTPSPEARIYLLWGTSFDPSAENFSLSASTDDLAPERSHTLELGTKWTVRRTLLLSAALFRTIQDNYREPSPIDPTLTTIAGVARAQGFELLAQGMITPRWRVLGGYTYLDAKIIASPDDDLGRPIQDAPRNSFRLFTSYNLEPWVTLGGQVESTSSRVPTSTPDANGFWQVAPGYTVASAVVRFRINPHVSVQLNVNNLFDTRYYDGTDDNHINVGAGRSAHLTVAVQR